MPLDHPGLGVAVPPRCGREILFLCSAEGLCRCFLEEQNKASERETSLFSRDFWCFYIQNVLGLWWLLRFLFLFFEERENSAVFISPQRQLPNGCLNCLRGQRCHGYIEQEWWALKKGWNCERFVQNSNSRYSGLEARFAIEKGGGAALPRQWEVMENPFEKVATLPEVSRVPVSMV